MNLRNYKWTAIYPIHGTSETVRAGFPTKGCAEDWLMDNGPGTVRRSTLEDIGHYRLEELLDTVCAMVNASLEHHADTLGVLADDTITTPLGEELARQVAGTLERLAELRRLRPTPPPVAKMGNVERAWLGGMSKSPAKVAASRKNGQLGGRNQI